MYTLKNSSLFLLFLLFFFHGGDLSAQKKTEKKNYNKYPYWVQMMDDPDVNYYEAQTAFREFWKNRPQPNEENELMGGKVEKKKSFLEKIFRAREEKREEEARTYTYQYKRFKHWEQKMLPYVQDNGRILNADERLNEWKKPHQ